MQSLSVICANVYPDKYPIEFLLNNLAAQTFRDFELVIVDAFHDENADFVAETAKNLGIGNVIHTPDCAEKNIGRYLHWELYNNALLFATSPWVLYHGVYRYLHRQAVQTVAECAANGTSVVLNQIRATSIDLPADVEQFYEMDIRLVAHGILVNTGFFSVNRDIMLRQLNGYNEALVSQHWVDNELSARARHVTMDVKMLTRAFLRLERSAGHYGLKVVATSLTGNLKSSRIGKSTCDTSVNPRCAIHLIEALQQGQIRIDGPVERFVHNGFEWVRCPECHTLAIEDGEAYIKHLLASPSLARAPVNVHGVGRDLAKIAADVDGLDLKSKIAIIAASHDNPKYLQ